MRRTTPINRKRFTVEILLDVVAKDAAEAEWLGNRVTRLLADMEIAHLQSAVVSDVREDEE
jgi:hypothetical protein